MHWGYDARWIPLHNNLVCWGCVLGVGRSLTSTMDPIAYFTLNAILPFILPHEKKSDWPKWFVGGFKLLFIIFPRWWHFVPIFARFVCVCLWSGQKTEHGQTHRQTEKRKLKIRIGIGIIVPIGPNRIFEFWSNRVISDFRSRPKLGLKMSQVQLSRDPWHRLTRVKTFGTNPLGKRKRKWRINKNDDESVLR